MHRLVKILRSKPFIIAASVILAYTLAGFFLAPFLVRHYVPKIVQEQLKKQAAIGEVRFNPYVFTFEVNDFRMDEPDGHPSAGFKRLFVDFELKSLFKWAWTFRRVSLEGPQVNAVIHHDGALNLAQLAPPAAAPPPPAADGNEALPRLIFEEIVVDQGQIDFTDRRQSTPAAITFNPFKLQMKNITTLPGQEGPDTITATTSDGETIRWTGRVSLNPVATKGTLTIENLRAATLWEFARDAVNLAPPAGKLAVTADYSMDLGGAAPQATLANLAVSLTGLELKMQGGETAFLEMPDLRLSGGRIDLARQQVEVEKIALTSGRVRLGVDENGTLNLERIAKASKAPAPAVPPASGGAAKPWKILLAKLDVAGFALDYRDASRTPGAKAGIGAIKVDLKAEAEAGGAETQVRVNDIVVSLSGLQAGLADAPDPAVRIDKIGLDGGAYDLAANALTVSKMVLDGGGIDLRRQADGAVNLVLLAAPPQEGAIARERAEAAAEGPPFQFLAKAVALSGFQVKFSDLTVKPDGPIIHLEDMAVSLADVDGKSPMIFDVGLNVREGGQIKARGTVNPAEPAVETDIEVLKLELSSFQPYLSHAAAVDLQSGTFSTSGALRHGIKAAGARTTYQGRFRVGNLHITEAGQKQTLVGWRSLATDQLSVQLEPDRLDIGDLRLALPAGKFIIEKNRSINLANVIKPGAEPKKVETPPPGSAVRPADPFPYRIRRILVSGGRVDFADLSLPTPFGTKIHELKGIVAGISSARNTRAQVELDGRVDEYGIARISGELNTADPKSFTDIGVVFRNVEMSSLTPYSGKFAGRKIDSGKLSVDLKYKVAQRQLAGDNQIVVERLVLGEKVESPEAVDLPLDLAIALLEDSNGLIDLGLPVKGDLDSPEFSIGAVVWKAFVSLITKIVTSPFRALGAILPGGGGEEAFNSVAFDPGRPEVPPPEKEKLAKLGDALQKRPQLKVVVQGRFNPETDLRELRTASLRRTLAVSLGRKLRRSSEPGPVDFGSPETGKALEAMFAERFGSDALKALKGEKKAAEEKAKKEAAAKGAASAAEGEPGDPGQLAKAMFARLAESEPIGEPELTRLAEARAQAIVAELGEAGRIPAERISVKPPAAVDRKDPVSALLDLEAGGSP
ncbi:MAG: DUF748 domain-containing protein [Deltaproteobacteria bacterium]|nr:DUF748 domain-containing protein [Deltaproteobacteria bacterium]